jgi:hypothetical protein
MRNLQSYVDEEYRKAPEEAMRLYDGKTIEEAFPHVLKSQLNSRLNKLEAGRQAMLRERSGTIANIQKGTYLMWKEGLDQLKKYPVSGEWTAPISSDIHRYFTIRRETVST